MKLANKYCTVLSARKVHKTTNEQSTQPKTKYPWQQLVLDALTEEIPEKRTRMINAAERTISAKMYDLTSGDIHEHGALRDALEILRELLPKGLLSREAKKRKLA